MHDDWQALLPCLKKLNRQDASNQDRLRSSSEPPIDNLGLIRKWKQFAGNACLLQKTQASYSALHYS
jgi:hypothetical protein